MKGLCSQASVMRFLSLGHQVAAGIRLDAHVLSVSCKRNYEGFYKGYTQHLFLCGGAGKGEGRGSLVAGDHCLLRAAWVENSAVLGGAMRSGAAVYAPCWMFFVFRSCFLFRSLLPMRGGHREGVQSERPFSSESFDDARGAERGRPFFFGVF